MVFSSFTFLFMFLPITILLYYLVPRHLKNIRNLILLFMSLLFYAWGEPIYVLLMIFSIIVNYFIGIKISQSQKPKMWLIMAIIFNIGLLFFYKYSNFLILNINNLCHTNIKLLELSLPIGISFYTFQILSYIIDVYNKKVAAQKNILTLATYIALFPQLIAGPIVRYITIEEELNNRKETLDNFTAGIRRFIIGLGKKVIIANNVAILADAVFNSNPSGLGSLICWLGALAYTLQIYFDFSGYSDMAIGLGKMFGFNFLENFNYPYIAKSITDFWRRWHMSLSTWFRDYVYIPLGGNRVNKAKWLFNIFIVWALTGLWHGASWNFVLWGLYYAFILIIEKLFLSKFLDKLPNILKHIYALFFIIIGWVIFRVENMSNLLLFLKNLFNFSHSNIVEFVNLNSAVTSIWPYFLLGIFGSMPLIKNLFQYIEESSHTWLKFGYDLFLLGIFGICIMFLVSASYNPFIYFRF